MKGIKVSFQFPLMAILAHGENQYAIIGSNTQEKIELDPEDEGIYSGLFIKPTAKFPIPLQEDHIFWKDPSFDVSTFNNIRSSRVLLNHGKLPFNFHGVKGMEFEGKYFYITDVPTSNAEGLALLEGED
jgi:hypothetical protein